MNAADLTLLAHDVATLRTIEKHGPISLAVLRNTENRAIKGPPTEPLSDRLGDLLGLKLIQRTRPNRGSAVVYSITPEGAAALASASFERAADAMRAMSDSTAQLATVTADFSRYVAEPRHYVKPGSYDGAELRPYTGRPGALDAFMLPSVVNGQIVPRKNAPARPR